MALNRYPVAAAVPEAPAARHLGDLIRKDIRWSVYMETRPDGNMYVGRIHFLDGAQRRSSAWIFREWNESEVLERFGTFSPVQLWSLVESLG